MQRKSIAKVCMFFVLAVAAAFALSGCSDGKNGVNGTNGTNATAPINAAVLTADQWAALAPKGEVTGVSIASAPVVKFKLTDANGNPISGLGFTSQKSTAPRANLVNMAFTIAKLVPPAAGSSEPGKWVNYIVLKAPAYVSATDHTIKAEAGSFPTTDNLGTLKDNGDGSYEYTFFRDIKGIKAIVAGLTDAGNNRKADLGDLTYEPNLTHRVGVQISGNARGTGTNTSDGSNSGVTAVAMLNPLNLVYDFIPATGQAVSAADNKRDIVMMASCQECHGTKGIAHGAGRNNPRYCVTCHTEQIKYGFAEATAGTTTTYDASQGTNIIGGAAVGNFPTLIHKIHMGEKLTKTGYNFNSHNGAMLFELNAYPQDIRNCTKCHAQSPAAPQGDNWKNVPSRRSCGACHDGIDFATGTGTTLGGLTTGHQGGAQSDDSRCVLCHNATTIPVYHTLPAAVDVSKRTMNATITGAAVAADGKVTVTFNMMKGATPVTDPYATLASFKSAAFTLAKLVPGVNGASSNWVSYTARARTKNASFAPVIQGYSENVVPANLTHVGNGVWTYTFALANADVAGDIRTVTHAHNVSTVAGAFNSATVPTYPNVVTYDATLTHRVGMEFSENADGTGNATNATYDFVPNGSAVATTRDIVNITSCQGCHAGNKLHKGYDTKYCVTCHNSSTFNPATINGTSPVNNNTVDLQTIIHKIHMGVLLSDTDYWINDFKASDVVFPSKPNNCLICHNETTTVSKNWRTTPTKEACGACHDGTVATAHITGEITASGGIQTCTLCHGTGRIADVQAVHNK